MPFHTNAATHDYHTRQKDDIYQPFVRHDYAKKCIRFDVPHVVNNTPSIILDKVHTHSLSGFSLYVKNYILDSYQDTCNIVNCYICSRN